MKKKRFGLAAIIETHQDEERTSESDALERGTNQKSVDDCVELDTISQHDVDHIHEGGFGNDLCPEVIHFYNRQAAIDIVFALGWVWIRKDNGINVSRRSF